MLVSEMLWWGCGWSLVGRRVRGCCWRVREDLGLGGIFAGVLHVLAEGHFVDGVL